VITKVKSPIIDFHAYLGSDAYGDYSQSVETLIQRMNRHSIERTVVAPLVDFPGTNARSHEELVSSIAKVRERFIPFARLDPRYGPEVADVLRLLVNKNGFEGLLFHAASCRTLPYHPGALPLLECAALLPIPVLIPAGDMYFALPEQIGLLAEIQPHLTIILGHMGTAFHAQRAIDTAVEHDNVYLETSLQQSPERIAYAVSVLGRERVLFGSAAPYGDLQSELVKIRQAHLSQRDQEAVLGISALHLIDSFKRKRDAHDH